MRSGSSASSVGHSTYFSAKPWYANAALCMAGETLCLTGSPISPTVARISLFPPKQEDNGVVWPLSSMPAAPCYSSAQLSSACCNGSNRSEEHTSELQSRQYLVCRLLLEKKK